MHCAAYAVMYAYFFRLVFLPVCNDQAGNGSVYDAAPFLH